MRTFKQFITRRKIKNLKGWVENMGFKSDEELAAWCVNQDIRPPDATFFAPILPEPNEPVVEVQPEPAAKGIASKVQLAKKKQAKKSKDPTWVPAAERSRKVKGRKPEVKPKKKIGDEDEEHTGATKESNTK